MARILELFDRSCVSCTHSWSSNPQVSEELPVCLLPLCHRTGWALLSLPPNASKPSPARAFRLYFWLLRWCLCDFDPSSDRRNCGDHLSVISTRRGVLLACGAVLDFPPKSPPLTPEFILISAAEATVQAFIRWLLNYQNEILTASPLKY